MTTELAASIRPLGADQPTYWRRGLGLLGGIVLGAVLLFAAWTKAIDPQAFAEQIHREGLDVWLPAARFAILAIALEVGLGAALLLGVRRLGVLLPAVLLVGFFLFLTGRTYWRAEHGLLVDEGSCGCFGNLVQRSPAEAFWQDLALLVPTLLLAFVGRPAVDKAAKTFPPVRTALGLLLAGGAAALAWKAPDLPLDNLATRLKPGVKLAGICAGESPEVVCLDNVTPDLRQGKHWVVITALDNPTFEAAIGRLNAYATAGGQPPVTVLANATPQEHFKFFWTRAPSFPLKEVPPALLRPLYRSLPRSFEIEDGKVTRTFPGLPPIPGPPAPGPA
jgi:uncharacterized membrane protein YphA (DoxX/SURF4 family)